MSSAPQKSTLDGLPRKFVNSLKVLFEILDENKTGFVYLADIEKRWSDNGTSGLPRGVVDALRKVTPESGRLSFERFVAGLKIALLRSKNDTQTGGGGLGPRPDLVPPRDNPDPPPYMRQTKSASDVGGFATRYNTQNTATVRPNVVAQHPQAHTIKTQSMPHLQNAQHMQDLPPPQLPDYGVGIRGPLMPPLFRPERASWNPTASQTQAFEDTMQQDNISAALHRWQNEKESGNNVNRGLGDGRASVASTTALDQFARADLPKEAPVPNKRVSRRKSDVRRHTLSNGVDFNMIKRMKQLEQEKDVLLQGLEMVEQARQWYHQQIVALQEKQKTIGRGSLQHDHSVEAYQERMNFQTARIQELNQQIKALLDSHEKGFPMHMNLAVSHNTYQSSAQTTTEPSESENIIAMLKAQNKMLTKEVGQMQERMTQLERDKGALVREVFETRSKAKLPSHDDTTFI